MQQKINLRTRHLWYQARSRLEQKLATDKCRSTRHGEKPQKSKLPLTVFDILLRLSGLYARGERNARALRLRQLDFSFPDLPAAFDGYKILHLSDIHVGLPADLLPAAAREVAKLQPDLVVLTGDYQTQGAPAATITAREICRLLTSHNGKDGVLAVLGNHDTGDMVDALENQGIRLLVNETVEIFRAGDRLRVVGLDDVHSFYTDTAPATLDTYREGFRIALIHTVDLAGEAAQAGYQLYLAGHSHGGQVCLPGGKPLLTSLDNHRELASGQWRLGDMQGYTNRGLGAQFPPVRFNCPGEIVMIRLKREISG